MPPRSMMRRVRSGRHSIDARPGALRGRELRYGGVDAEPLRIIIRDRLLRRLSAPRRIGCPYRLVAFDAAADVDASFWLPAEMLAQFL